ncbi:class II fructose-bisphosphate aldolase [Anaerolentibacter hominis]|uniref:class II fructose-bisphosphate aldolase n=1 Tax=Anaerolentibacter hominis TaxID=3079009 RepID=UPI0031B84130
MLVTLADMMKDANARNYAVIAANCYNYESARCLIKAAEAEKSPLIINIAEGHLASYIKRESLAQEISPMCEATWVPVCINLDHGFTFEVIVSAISNGFTSVMTDNSVYSLEDNIERTKKIVDIAHGRGISVEAEIGHVGQGDDMSNPGNHLTDPEEAKKFVDATGIDALAIAVGTAHGEYHGTPVIDFDRIKEIKALLKMPLVLHGGSGSGDENLATAVDCGINKINVFTDNQANARDKVYEAIESSEKKLYPLDMMKIIWDGIQEKCQYYMRLFKSSGKADGSIEKTEFHMPWDENADL